MVRGMDSSSSKALALGEIWIFNLRRCFSTGTFVTRVDVAVRCVKNRLLPIIAPHHAMLINALVIIDPAHLFPVDLALWRAGC